jgi:hypothetical protein
MAKSLPSLIIFHRKLTRSLQSKSLYSEIHQAPSLETLIHAIFPALAINYANQGYMDGRAILTTKNIVVNSLNTQIVEAVPRQEHVFLSVDSVETKDD